MSTSVYTQPLQLRREYGTKGCAFSSLLLARLSLPSRFFRLGSGHYTPVRSLGFFNGWSGESPLLSVDEVGQLSIWNLSKPKSSPTSIKAHEESINKVIPFPSQSPTSTYCVTASDDKTLCIWDIETNASLVRALQGHSSYVTCCDVEKEGRIIGSSSLDSTVRLWHPSVEHHVFLLRTPRPASSVCFLQGRCYLLVTAATDGVHIWDIRNHSSYVEKVAGVSESSTSATPSNTASEWMSSIPRSAHRSAPSPQKPVPEGLVATFHNANTTINTSYFDKSTNKFRQLFTGHTHTVFSAICSYENAHVITSSATKHKLWDAYTRQGMYTFDWGSQTCTPVLSHDDRLLVSGSMEGEVVFWSTFAGADEDPDPTFPNNSLKSVKTSNSGIVSICLNADDTIIATGDQNGDIYIRSARDDLLDKATTA